MENYSQFICYHLEKAQFIVKGIRKSMEPLIVSL